MANYTIVSFCGGGVRGVLSARILELLAETNPQILSNTSLMAGTSTGSGIISALLGPNAQSPATIVANFYFEASQFYSKLNTSPVSPGYTNEQFVNAQTNLHGTRTLADLLPQQVLFTAFNVGAAASSGTATVPWSPLLFNNVPQVVSTFPQLNNADTGIVDAVVASGSMPGMLPSYNGNVDGAFVHHDPTLAAIALAVNAGIDINDIAAICIGTGFMANYIGSDTSTWGANQWLNGDGTGNYQVPPLLVNEAEVSPILNLCLNGTSTNLMPMLAGLLLGDRYVSLNPTLDRYIPENDSTIADLDYLVAQAKTLDLTKAQALLATYW